jgi:Uma2 family endonuclease
MSTTTMQVEATPKSDNSWLMRPSPNLLPDLYRMTVDEYEQLVKTGVLDARKVELIQGLLVRKMGKNPPHVVATGRLLAMFEDLLPAGWHVRKEDPVRIPNFNEPEPDLAIVAGVLEDYLDHHPTPPDLALLVEVAETTLDRDQNEKQFAYAQAAIPTYWIVNLVERQVEVYTNPNEHLFRDRQIFTRGSHVPVTINGLEIGQILVDDILPPSVDLATNQ